MPNKRDEIRDCPTGSAPMMAEPVVCRLAPSPTGRMHAGNVFSALMSWLIAKSHGGKVVLRIEDLDEQRSRPEYADQVMRDFEMLGLTWDEGPVYQHDRQDAYRDAYERLQQLDLTYPCFCTRADLHAASAPHRGEKLVYAGTCRALTDAQRAERLKARKPAYRLLVPDEDYSFTDLVQGAFCQNLMSECGDFIVRRSDGMFAYQLAVVVDDAYQGVNCVVRGMDLLVSTPQQMYLQRLLQLKPCSYAHVPLLVAEVGRRLSKRDKDAGIDQLVGRFGSPAGVIGHIAHLTGIAAADEPCMPEDLVKGFTIPAFPDNVQIIWE